MRKFFLYIVTIVCLIFIIPFLLTAKFKEIETITYEEMEQPEFDKEPYNYGEYKQIKVVNSVDNITTEMNLDEYLLGVVSAEMPADYEIEALKAQAVVARTYTLYTITHNNDKHGEGVICTSSSCCQAWISKEERMEKWEEDERNNNWKKIEEAVYSTKGEVIEYEGQVIDAFFHANSGGKTEIPVNVWGGTNYPYLQTVETAGEEGYSQYSSEVELSKKEFEGLMKEKYKDFEIDWNEKNAISISEYTDGGRVKLIKIGNKNLSGVEVRSIFSLKSANFICKLEGDNIKFSVIGYGHGVGLSQTGADSMAKNGSNYKDIILHFYANVQIVSI
ncbi:MAG: stage II sporulation protein D [Clostridia bacterium]|nr:stage II sporulation protein D [Clostridia bacterium]